MFRSGCTGLLRVLTQELKWSGHVVVMPELCVLVYLDLRAAQQWVSLEVVG